MSTLGHKRLLAGQLAEAYIYSAADDTGRRAAL